MSYTPTNWETGDTITAEKLNKLEQGVANAGGSTGGGVLVVHDVDGTLDKTWQEITDAMLSGGAVVAFDNPTSVKVVTEVFNNAIGYCVVFGELFYASETSDGYPTNQDE